MRVVGTLLEKTRVIVAPQHVGAVKEFSDMLVPGPGHRLCTLGGNDF